MVMSHEHHYAKCYLDFDDSVITVTQAASKSPTVLNRVGDMVSVKAMAYDLHHFCSHQTIQ